MFKSSLIGASLVLMSVSALGTAANEPSIMHIVSDSSQYNYKAHETWFLGHVKVDQGPTHLSADRVITRKNAQNKIREAVAFGEKQPAHYWREPQSGEKEVQARAKIMKFYPLESRVVLEGNVMVTQGENRFQGQIIVYNVKQQTITVPPTKGKRATFVFEPSQLKQML